MNTLLSRLSRLLIMRGALALIFGAIAIALPGITLTVLVIWFGAFIFVDGVFLTVTAVRAAREHQSKWWAFLLQGVVSILLGVVACLEPGLTAISLLYLVAFWAIFTGITEIAAAIRLRHEINNEWLLGLDGGLSVILGIVFLRLPGAGLIVWIWIIGTYALISGVLLIALGIRLRHVTKSLSEQDAHA